MFPFSTRISTNFNAKFFFQHFWIDLELYPHLLEEFQIKAAFFMESSLQRRGDSCFDHTPFIPIAYSRLVGQTEAKHGGWGFLYICLGDGCSWWQYALMLLTVLLTCCCCICLAFIRNTEEGEEVEGGDLQTGNNLAEMRALNIECNDCTEEGPCLYHV